MKQLGISAIHPTAPDIISAAALYRAPIDLEAAVERIGALWREKADAEWVTVEANPANPDGPTGKILTFRLQGVQVMLTPVNSELQLPQGQLPGHNFHVAMSFYAPLAGQSDGVLAGERPLEGDNADELSRRHRMVSAHIVYTMTADALLREEAAIGTYRHELGVVHPPEMVEALAQALTQGQAPLPLWVNIRLGGGDTQRGRTLGLPAFGHLDLEINESAHSVEEIHNLLASIANYVIMGDAYLLPGQTLGLSESQSLELSQDVSLADGSTVIRIDY